MNLGLRNGGKKDGRFVSLILRSMAASAQGWPVSPLSSGCDEPIHAFWSSCEKRLCFVELYVLAVVGVTGTCVLIGGFVPSYWLTVVWIWYSVVPSVVVPSLQG